MSKNSDAPRHQANKLTGLTFTRYVTSLLGLLTVIMQLLFFSRTSLAETNDPPPTISPSELQFRHNGTQWTAETDLAVPGNSITDLTQIRSGAADIDVKPEGPIAGGPQLPQLYHLTIIGKKDTPPDPGSRTIFVGRFLVSVSIAKPANPTSWTVAKIGPIAVETGTAIPIVVTTSNEPITGLRLVPNTLFEKDSEHPLGGGKLLLVDPDQKPSGTGINVPAHAIKTLNIVGSDQSGHYTGSVTVTASEGSTATSSDTTIDLSTLYERMVGVAVIAIGLLLSTVGMATFRKLYARERSYWQASLALRRIDALRTEIRRKCHEQKTPSTEDKLTELKEGLSKKELNKLSLPPLISSSPLESSDPNPPIISTYLNGISAQIAAIERIVRGGLEPVHKRIAAATSSDKPALITTFSHLDDLSTGLTPSVTLDGIQSKIDSVLQASVHANLFTSVSLRAGTEDLSSPEHFERSLVLMTWTAWAFLILATLLAGAYALLFSSVGNSFSLKQDWAQCLLWGLGLPAGAQALQVTLSSVFSALNVSRGVSSTG